MPTIQQAEETVRRCLSGKRAPRLTPQLRRLAEALPIVAEQWRVLRAPELAMLTSAIVERWWPAAVKHHDWEEETAWPLLGASCFLAAELLGLDLSGLDPTEWRWKRKIDEARNTLRRPRVLVLLRDAPPVRVLLANCAEGPDAPGRAASEDPWVLRCEYLLGQLFGKAGAVRLALALPAEGTSQLAGLLVRAFIERVMAHAPSHPWLKIPIGVTGELTEDGLVLPVLGCVEKVRRFLDTHTDGICLVPRANWIELSELRPRESNDDPLGLANEKGRLTASQWGCLYPISSALELMVRLGLVSEDVPATRLFAEIRERAAFVSDWRGQSLRTEQLVELKLRESHLPRKRLGLPGLLSADWSIERMAQFLSGRRDTNGQRPIIIVSGGPGSGKSMVLQRLLHELNGGARQLDGPAIIFRVREMREGDTWFIALARKLNWPVQQVAAALSDPTLASGTVLLLDGLDEAPPPLRHRLLADAHVWPGPLVLASRQLREAEQWPALRLVIQTLGWSERRELLALAGRADLADSLGSVHESLWDLDGPLQTRWSSRPEQSPAGRTFSDLASTPLGLSLLATLLKSGTTSIDSRVQLLREGISHLLDRAEAEGKINETERRLFDGRGTRYLGAAAWKMLSEGRAVLSDDDLVWASLQVQAGPDVEVRLVRVLDSSGFLQRCGPQEREFSHKSFAEYCAATFLKTERAQLDRIWERVGDSGIDEVLLHLSSIANPTALLRELLDNNERPFSSLALATRILVECMRKDRPADKQVSLVVEVIKRRLRILGRFPNWEIPADLGTPGLLWQALRRWRDVLGSHVAALIAACPMDVGQWLSDPPTPQRKNQSDAYHMDHSDWPTEPSTAKSISAKLAEQLHAALRFDIPIRALLRMRHGAALLASLPRTALLEQLPNLCGDPDPIIREAALDAEAEYGPLNRLCKLLGPPATVYSAHGQEAKRRKLVLCRFILEGSPLQKKEALIQAGMAATKIEYSEPSDDESPHRTAYLGNAKYVLPWIEPHTNDSPSAMMAAWRNYWGMGVLGEKGDDILEELYAVFLHDDVAEARQRAIDALLNLWEVSQWTSSQSAQPDKEKVRLPTRFWQRSHDEVRSLLSDRALGVRVAAANYVIKTKTPFLIEEVLPLWLSSDGRSRIVGMALALDADATMPLDVLLEALCDAPEKWPGDSGYRWRVSTLRTDEVPPAPTATRWDIRLTAIARDARHRITEALSRDATAQLRQTLFDLLDQEKYSSVAHELLDIIASSNKGIATSELRQQVEHGKQTQHQIARRWAVRQIAHRSQDARAAELLRHLTSDWDDAVAKVASEAVKRIDEQTAWMLELEQRRVQPPRTVSVPVRELTLGAVRGFETEVGPRAETTEAQAEPFRLNSLNAYTSFEDLWSVLREKPLELKSWASVDYEGRDDRVDHIALLAEKAWIDNHQKTTLVANRLRELYVPQRHRELCLRNLDHPLLGLWAEVLLSASARERDLLPLVARSPRCAARVASIAHGTELAPAVVDAFIAAVNRGFLRMDPPPVGKEESFSHQDDTPMWFSSFAVLGGLEGLVRLIQAKNVEASVRQTALTHIGKNQAKLTTNLSEGARAEILGWARETARRGDQGDRVLALYLLALIGTPEDATAWVDSLMVVGVPERVAQAALRLIRIHGTPEQAPGLRSLLNTVDSSLLGGVLYALAAHGDQSDVEVFFAMLSGQRNEGERWDNLWSRERWYWEEHVRDTQSAALEGIVRHGDQKAAYRLLRQLIRSTNASAAAEQQGVRGHYDDDSESESTAKPLRPIRANYIPASFGTVGMEDTSLKIAAEYGRLPIHCLLVVGALLRDPGDEEYAVNIEGYDEVMVSESKIPKQAAAALKAIIERTDREAVRRALLRCVLWGGPSSDVARVQLDRLGGPQRRDLSRIVKALARHPTSRSALSLLAKIGTGEKDLAQLWLDRQIL